MREFIKKNTFKKLTALLAILLALCLGISVFFAVGAVFADTTDGNETARATTNNGEGERVSMLELMERYPVDFVLGPVDVEGNGVNDDGEFTYKKDPQHYVRDSAGNPVLNTDGSYKYTNNTYGIPADQYFDVESYIYTEPITGGGRTLFGWKPNIRGVELNSQSDTIAGIAENGAIMTKSETGNVVSNNIGIYVDYQSGSVFGTTKKYALIVPNDIKVVGCGSAAFVGMSADTGGTQTTYYNTLVATANSNSSYVAKFTDFASFLYESSIASNHTTAPHFWQPRERLVGVYFDEGSQLKTITGSTVDSESNGNRTVAADAGKPAFMACDNLRFFILPNGIETIGQGAFKHCSQLVDINIPSNVKTIGNKAYGNCSSIQHLTIPAKPTGGSFAGDAFDGCSKLRDVVDINKSYSSLESTVYAYTANNANAKNNVLYTLGGKPTKNADGSLKYDTGGNGFLFIREPGKNGAADTWHAQGLAGKTGEGTDAVFVFPSSDDFVNGGDRRRDIRYDYLGCDGEKTFSSFTGVTKLTEYDIAEDFAKDTWCQNIVLPKEVKTIGANAFNNSHVKYLETYATTIGAGAFGHSNNGEGIQWYYFHQTPDANGNYTASYNVSTTAFVKSTGTRYIVYDDYNMYQNVSLSSDLHIDANNGGNNIHTYQLYQIPIVAHIENENVGAVTIDTSDMDDYFFNDPDYVKSVISDDGTKIAPSVQGESSNSITYTKKLSGRDFEEVKQANGSWAPNTTRSNKQVSPILSNMAKTVWYPNANCTKDTQTDAKEAFDNKSITASAPNVNIYTKNVKTPVLENKTYTFGDKVKNGVVASDGTQIGDNSSITFYNALGLDDATSRDNFVISYTSVQNASNSNVTTEVKEVQNAGTYNFRVKLNSDRWGTWTEDFEKSFTTTATVKVNQQIISIESLAGLPQFVLSSNKTALRGNGDTLFRYPDGWYLTQQPDKDKQSEAMTTNGYTYYTGQEIKIGLDENHDLIKNFGSVIEVLGVGDSSISGDNYAIYTFDIKYNSWSNYNYAFDPSKLWDGTTDDTGTQNNSGITIMSRETQRYRISKRWFIVIETNMFVDVNAKDVDTQYVAVKKGDAAYYDWIYTDDTFTVHTPKLAYNNATGEQVLPTMEIKFTPYGTNNAVTLVEAGTDLVAPNTTGYSAVNTLEYYINSSMPAGRYVITVSAGAVTADKQYAAFSNIYEITVSPKQLDSAAVSALNSVLYGSGKNEYALGDKKLHDDITAPITALNATLNAISNGGTYKKVTRTGYWADTENDGYYSTGVDVTYNLEGSGNTTYSNYETMLSQLVSANDYTLYYCLSAKNYVTYGGADDASRQDKVIKTTLYDAISIKEFYDYIQNVNGLYFQNVTYTGEDVYPNVPASRHYKYEFNDEEGYVNTRVRASVTLTLHDSNLARWNNDTGLSETELANYFKISADKTTLDVYFDIVAADNSWDVVPQMPSWAFNGFDSNINFITAGLKFTGADVKYALIPKSVDADKVNYGDNTAGVVFFTVQDGKVNDEVAILLNALKPGDYYLKSYIGSIDHNGVTNVKSFDFVQIVNNANFASVTVTKASNRWTSTPNIIRWTWDTYKKDVNVISAQALYPNLLPAGYDKNTFSYGNNVPVITYSIVRSNGDAIEGLESFTSVTESVETALKGLDAGNYILRVSLGETDYYSAIETTEHGFEVFKANNSWTTTPGVTGWQYKSFSGESFIFGVPKYGKAEEIKYTLSGGDYADEELGYAYKTEDGKLVLTLNGDTQNLLNALSVLKTGSYTVKATLVGSNDYENLEYETTFTVIKAANSWDTTPGLTGWVYNSFAAGNFTAGIANLRDVADTDVVYTLSLNGATQFIFTELTEEVITKLNNLPANNYVLVASYRGTDNYDDLPQTITFSVTQIANTWTTSPRLTSFQYNRFNSLSNFVAGVPKYPVTDSVVYYGIYVGNAENVPSDVVSLTDFNAIFGANDKTFTSIDDAKDFLNGLKFGEYTLCVYVEDGGNFSDLYAVISFSVTTAAPNSWTKLASITGWTYNSLTEENVINYVTSGESEFGADKIVYTVRKVDQSNNVITDETGIAIAECDFDALKVALISLGAGNYNLLIKSPATSEWAEASQDIFFTVSKAQNEWATIPSLNSGWTYGDSVIEPVTGVTRFDNDKFDGENYKITYTYYFAKQSNGSWVPDTDKGVITEISKADAGTYALVVTADETANYLSVSHTSTFTISRRANNWTATPEGTLTWTWGEQHDYKLFKLEVEYPIEEDDKRVNPVVYTIEGVEKTADELKKLGAGSYEIKVTVAETTNYYGNSATVYVTVNSADFIWNPAPTDANWQWDKVVDKESKFVKAGATPVLTDDDYTIKYSVDSLGDYTSYDTLLVALDKAGTYQITVTVSGANYNTLTKTVTVIITLNENEWTENAPQLSGTKEFEEEAHILAASAKFGDVKYKVGDYEYDSVVGLNDFLKTASSGTYNVYTFVKEDIGHYPELRQLTVYTITGKGSVWGNQTELNEQAKSTENTSSAQLTYTYGSVPVFGNSTLVLPVKPNGIPGTPVQFTVKALNPNDVEISGSGYATQDPDIVYNWTKNYVNVGKLVIKAKFEPADKSYMELVYTITIIIKQAQVGAGEPLDDEYNFTYGSKEITEIATPVSVTEGYKADYVITVSNRNNNEVIADNVTNLSVELAKLNIGDYIVTYYVPDDTNGNYIGLTAKTARVIIQPAVNSWKAVGGIAVSEWNDGKSWTFERGETISVVLPEAVIGTVKLTVAFDTEDLQFESTAELNKYLNGKNIAAGTYTLRFTVDASDKGNYNGLTSNCTLVINKKPNEFTDVPEDYTESGSVTGEVVGKPDASVSSINGTDLLRFDIVKAGDSSASRTGIAYSAYKDYLFVNGSYTVTVYVGVELSAADDYYKSALALYLADYDLITASFTVNITRKTNGWTTSLTGANWVWGTNVNGTDSTVNIDMPEAVQGNDKIIYTVSKDNETVHTIKAGGYNENAATRAFNDLIAYFNNKEQCGIGTYSVTVSIDASDTYEAALPVTAIFVVSAAANSWSDDYPDGKTVNWTYAANNDNIVFKVTNEGGKETVLVNNAPVPEGKTLMEHLKSLDAGTHTISVSVTANENYAAISKTISLVIAPADNKWNNNTGYSIDNWTWSEAPTVTGTTPIYGDSVTISIYDNNDNLQNTVVIGNSDDLTTLKAKLAELNAGSYKAVASVAAGTNYQALI